MSPLARAFRNRAIGLLGVVTAVAAAVIVGAPAAQADDVRSRQWYLDAMKAEELWKVSTGKGITVAVLDSGVDSTVSELRGKVLSGPDYVNGEGDARTDAADTVRHGTNMAAYIAGSGANGGIRGLAPDTKILPVRVGLPGGKGAFLTAEPMIKGIRYAVDHGSRVINISMGAFSEKRHEADLQAAVDYALRKGALIFASTGNEGDHIAKYPAVVPGVVAVGAVDTKGKVADFSNYGDHVALAAPGDHMPGRCKNDKTRFCDVNGTSGATALASASAALIWSAHPEWTNNQVLRVMMQTAGHNGPVPSKYIGYGSVRPAQVLLEGKGDPGPANVNPLLEAQRNNSPAPQNSPNSPSPESTGASDEDGRSKESQAAPEAAARSEEGGFPLWAIVASAVAVVALIGGAVAVSVRSRRA